MTDGKAAWLAELAPAHAPAAPGWWPLAPGWWVVSALILISIAAIAYWQTRPSVSLRRIALRDLERLEELASDDQALAIAIENLLRRYALARFGRAAVAGLSDPEQQVFLLRVSGELPFEAIAATLAIPVGTAKTRMRSALQKLRQSLGVTTPIPRSDR